MAAHLRARGGDVVKHRLVLVSPHAPQVFYAHRLGTFDDFEALEIRQFIDADERTRNIVIAEGERVVAWYSDLDQPLIPLTLTRYDLDAPVPDPVANDRPASDTPYDWPRKRWQPPEPPVASGGVNPS